MTEYNFDEVIDRAGTNAIKYDLRRQVFGTDDVIPMWVADMDFRTPDFIMEAIRQRASHEILGYTKRSNGFFQSIIEWFADGKTVDITDDMHTEKYYETLVKVNGLRDMAMEHLDAITPGEIGLAMEFLLEGLHQNSLLSKRDVDCTTSYRDMLKAMLDQVTDEPKD